MHSYNQIFLTDANTDSYSTIVAFEEEQDRRQQESQAKTLQDGSPSLDTNFDTAGVISSAFVIALVVLAFVSSRNTREALMRIMVVFMVLPMMGMGYYLIYILPNHVESSFMGDIFGADKLDFIIHDPTFLFICGAQIVTLIVGGVLAHTLDRLYPPEK